MPGPRRVTPPGLGVALAALFLVAPTVVLLAGCASPAPTPGSTPAASNGPTVGAPASGPAASEPAIASPASPAATSGGSIEPSPSIASVPIDPSLMDVLPAQVAGLPVTAVSDPSGTDDPGLVQSLDRMVEAVVIDPASGDFAYASVIDLQPGVFDEGWFRSWRDSFDVGACSQAGGVTGHAEATIGGRKVFIGRCAGGVLTYHVRLDGPDEVVSVSSLGASHLGEQLVAGLRP